MNQTPSIALLARLLLLAGFAWNVVLFARALRRNFTRPGGVPLLMLWLAVCGTVAIVVDGWLLATVEVQLVFALIGLALVMLSQVVFQAAVRATAQHRLSLAFSADAPAHLNDRGIYARVRHPFYLAYTLNWLGAATATRHGAAFLLLALMLGFYIAAARREEQKFLQSPLARAYNTYRRQAGMFLPKIFRQPNLSQKPNT